MIEIFNNIPDKVKEQAEFIFNIAIKYSDISRTIKILNNYINTCINEEEKKFVEFYFNLRMEQLLNGNNNNQR